MSRRDLYVRILKDLATRPLTFFPFVLGLSLMLMSTVTDARMAFAGFVSLLVSAANFSAQLVSGNVSRSVVEKLEHDLTRRRDRELDELQAKLSADGDPRTQDLLSDLRALVRGFHESGSWFDEVGVRMTFDLQSRVEELFNTAVKWLLRTLDLHELQKKVSSKAVREQFRQERERIIGDVSQATLKLGSTLAAVQRLGSASADSPELNKLLRELDEEINIAMTVERRLQEGLREGASDFE